jgi:hypothetical protein
MGTYPCRKNSQGQDMDGSKERGASNTRNVLVGIGALVLLIVLLGRFSATSGPDSAPPKPAITAAELLTTVNTRESEGDYKAARIVASTLLTRYPGSPEAIAVKARLPAIDASAAKAQAAATALQAAEAAQAKIQVERDKADAQARVTKALAGFTKEYDEVRHITFYLPRNVAMKGIGTFFGLYLAVEDDGGSSLHAKFQYGGDDWLFIEGMTISVDGTTLPEITFPRGAVQRDNGGGSVWEWHDEAIEGAELKPFMAMAASKKVIIRFQGQQYYKDHVLTDAEKKEIIQMIAVYSDLRKTRGQVR